MKSHEDTHGQREKGGSVDTNCLFCDADRQIVRTVLSRGISRPSLACKRFDETASDRLHIALDIPPSSHPRPSFYFDSPLSFPSLVPFFTTTTTMADPSDILPPSLNLPPHLSAHKYFFVCTLTVAAWDTLVLSPRAWRLFRTKEWPALKIIFHILRFYMPIEFTIVGKPALSFASIHLAPQPRLLAQVSHSSIQSGPKTFVAFLRPIHFHSDDLSSRHARVSTSSSRSAPPSSSLCALPCTSSAFTLSTRRAGLFSLAWVVCLLFKSSSLPSVVVSSAVSFLSTLLSSTFPNLFLQQRPPCWMARVALPALSTIGPESTGFPLPCCTPPPSSLPSSAPSSPSPSSPSQNGSSCSVTVSTSTAYVSQVHRYFLIS